MADYLKLFMAKRLTTKEPHQLEIIKGRLAAMKVEDPARYEEYSEHYGIKADVHVEDIKPVVVEVPVGDEKDIVVEKKKRGRPAKA